MADQDPKAIVAEIENLQTKIDEISGHLNGMKAKAQQGQKISADDLKLTVSNINRLDMMMRERQDVGH